MKANRKAKAREAAERNAPNPVGSSLTYGFIGVVLVGLALIAFTTFYQTRLTAIPVGIALVGGFVVGIVLRKVRRRRHVTAYDAEYERRDDEPSG